MKFAKRMTKAGAQIAAPEAQEGSVSFDQKDAKAHACGLDGKTPLAELVGARSREFIPAGSGSTQAVQLEHVLSMLPMLSKQEMESLTAWEQSNLGSVCDWPGWAEVMCRASEIEACVRTCSKGAS